MEDISERFFGELAEGRKIMSEWLDISKLKDFEIQYKRNVFIFPSDKTREKSSIYYAVRNRVGDAAKYLNELEVDTEEKFMSFITYTCILLDGIEFLCKEKGITFNNGDNKYFNQIHGKTTKEKYNDYKYFNYLRSLIMAHPLETSYAPWLKENGNEIQYCPFVDISEENGDIIVTIFIDSNKHMYGTPLKIPLDIFRKYVKSKFELLTDITKHLRNELDAKEKELKEDIIDSSLSSFDKIKEIKRKLDERGQDINVINDLELLLTFESSREENDDNIEEFRNYVFSKVDELVECFNNMDYSNLEGKIMTYFYSNPPEYEDLRHPFEKIDNLLLEDYKDDLIPLISAKRVYDVFGKNWVTISFDNMEREEISSLLYVSYFFEKNSKKEKK